MRRCLITFCPANHKMNRMVMVITEDSDLITVTPQGDGNEIFRTLPWLLPCDLITVTPQGDGNLHNSLIP